MTKDKRAASQDKTHKAALASQALLSQEQVDWLFQQLAAWLPADDDNRARLVPQVKTDADLFRSLVGCLLSAQSKDENTAKAKAALMALADTPAGILALTNEQIVAAIKPAGLYNVKARNLRKLCEHLTASNDPIPRDRKGLMGLPGIGRKCADIVLRFALGESVIAVDTHVHRVCNRLGLARGKTEAETAACLEPRVPEWARHHGHMRLLEFGKQVCQARKPNCAQCQLAEICAYGTLARPDHP
ncbi:MAG: endonuclease III [Xanthomonadales bacterium]|nr:endonuclease III [Xanthomonadales bacterium]